MSETFIVTATPPTPNGDFHVGHFAGPYLGADIFTRFQRMRGHNVKYVSSADLNQTYVVTTAERLSVDPDLLAENSHRDMIKTLRLGEINMDMFNKVDAQHINLVQDFLRKVGANGHVKFKQVEVPFSLTEDRFMFEAFVSGSCPTCWAPTAGAICETCGHPNDFKTLHLTNVKGGDGDVEYRTVKIAVLELERYRKQFEQFYAEKKGVWRPHLVELVEELLARPLPDYPLTYPGSWGIPAPFSETKSQVINVWAEMLPGLINSTNLVSDDENFWTADSNARLVQFLGYDNSFFFSMVHLALAWAHGDCIVPSTIVTNEFFELDNFKFSTSKGHLIWARHLVQDVDVSIARFFLSLTNPELQKMNFTRSAMATLTEVRLTSPLVRAAEQIKSAASRLGLLGETLVTSRDEAAEMNGVLDRFGAFYSEQRFSPQRVAEHLSQLLVRIGDGAAHANVTGSHEALRWSVAAFYLVLPIVAQPMMPSFSNRMAKTLGRSAPDQWAPIQPRQALKLDADQLDGVAQIFAESNNSQLRRVS